MKKIFFTFLAFTINYSLSFAQWSSNSNGSIYNNNTGNVGIGTTTPQATLDVNGTISMQGFSSISSQRNAINNYTNLFLGGAIKDNGNGTFTVIGDGGSNYFSAIRSDNSGGNAGALNFYSGGTVGGSNYNITNANLASYLKMTIVGGNVGIGTSTPSSLLSVTPSGTGLTNQPTNFVAGTYSVLGNTAGSYLYPFEFQHTNTTNVDRLQILPYRRTTGTGWPGTAYRLQFAVDNSYTNGSMSFIEVGAADPENNGGGFISLATGGTDRLCVNSAGNVIIGKTMQKNTSYLLDIYGTARANAIVVNSDGADFVFAPKYHLNSLPWLEKYINQNHHLPEIPSAKQMQADGLNVGDNQVKLLQKVEELTLYLIEKDKEVKDQKVINKQLSSQLESQQTQINTLIKQLNELSKTINNEK